MTKESKIYLFKDRNDYIKKITNDNIINITGEKGSGKSYFGINNDIEDNIVIHLDIVFSPLGNKEHNDSLKVRKLLLDKYNNLDIDKYFEEKYYKDIVKYLNKTNKKCYIEGGSISEIEDISIIKGTIIVKRTSVIKCFNRTIKRDYNNKYFMEEERKKHKYIYKITRLYKVIKRRIKIFKEYKNIELFIDRIEKINNND